jgi:hypothetical protein
MDNFTQENPLNNDKTDVKALDDNKVDVDQDIKTKGNRVLILLCSCFNWLT